MSKEKRRMTLRRFRPDVQLKRESTVVVLGKRRSGKTILQRQLLHDMKFERVVIMTGSEEGKEFFPKFVPDSYIYDGFQESLMKMLILEQKRRKRKYKGDSDKDLVLACVLEDLSFDTSVMRSDVLSEVFHNGRHAQFFLLMAVQYVMSMPRKIRANVDYVFIFKDNDVNNRKNIHKSWGGMINSFVEFDEILQAVTDDHRCLVIDNTSQNSDPGECLFWFKADLNLPDFQVGGRDYRLAHEMLRKRGVGAEVTAKVAFESAPKPCDSDQVVDGTATFEKIQDENGNIYHKYNLSKANLVLENVS